MEGKFSKLNKVLDQISNVMKEFHSLMNSLKEDIDFIKTCNTNTYNHVLPIPVPPVKVCASTQTDSQIEPEKQSVTVKSNDEEFLFLDLRTISAVADPPSTGHVKEDLSEAKEDSSSSYSDLVGTGITSLPTVSHSSLDLCDVAYVAKGLDKSISPEDVKVRLLKYGIPVVHCSHLVSTRSGKPLKHMLTILEKPTSFMLKVTSWQGKDISVENYSPAKTRKKSPTGNTSKEDWRPPTSKDKNGLRNFERRFFRNLFMAFKNCYRQR